jgi:hypothetical protein
MKRSCSERMWFGLCPSIESSDASLNETDSRRILSIVLERCQQKPPESGADFVAHRLASVKIPRNPPELGKLFGQVFQSIDDQVHHPVLPLK